MTKDELLRSTLEDLNRLYIPGLYEFLYRHKGGLYKQLLDNENELDSAFLTGSADALKKALRDYWTLHMKAIQLFTESGKVDSDFRKAREEILEDRLST
jgi:hypothetical protein